LAALVIFGQRLTGYAKSMESVALQVIPKKEPSFYLFKHKDIDGLQLPLKGSSRVKVSFD
jgi:hypothetical protein